MKIPDSNVRLTTKEHKRRLALQIQAMSAKAIEAAEARYPGFEAAMTRLVKRLDSLEET